MNVGKINRRRFKMKKKLVSLLLTGSMVLSMGALTGTMEQMLVVLLTVQAEI